jgi:dTDP-glucose pyrophosphorylase
MIEELNCTIQSDATVRRALEVIDHEASGVALILDRDRKLLGVLTDGDVRRALLQGASLDDPVNPWVSTSYISVGPDAGRAEVLDLMQAQLLRQVPVVDDEGRLQGLHLLHDVIGRQKRDNVAVIMAGGKGTRLRPLTEHLPKPMIRVAGRPILERLVLHLAGFGVTRIYLAINYKGHMIEDHFGNGSHLGCSIEYLRESEPLGTGGALSLLPEIPDAPLLVMNGDLVMQTDFEQMLYFHSKGGYWATMGVKPYRHEVPFGCVEARDGRIVTFREKPSVSMLINSGVYVLSPEALADLPQGAFPITDLLENALQAGHSCGSFPVEGEWADVGRMDDLDKARGNV